MAYSDTLPKDWNEIQTSLGAHFLQNIAWAKFQQALGRRVFCARGKGWSWLAVLEKSRLGTRLYCPYGPTYKSATAFEEALVTLKACATKEGAMMIRLEPQGPLGERQLPPFGLTRAPFDIQPQYSWIKDLAPEEDELLSEASATNRNLYRTAEKKGLSFRAITDPAELPIFLEMLGEVAQRNHIHTHSDDYFTMMANTLFPLGAATLYIAEHDGQPIAGSLCFDDERTRYYAHAASKYEARKLQASSPLVMHMLLDAKRGGQKTFDFYGITASEDPHHPWAGLSKFKQSFGGQAVNMNGTWELGVRPGPYLLYKALRRVGLGADSLKKMITRG